MIPIALVNKSASVTTEQAVAIAAALEEQANGPFAVWGCGPVTVNAFADVPAGGFYPITLLDTAPPEDGILGVHEETGDLPTGEIYVPLILAQGGTILDGTDAHLTVSSTCSHELLEICADSTANIWANDLTGKLFAREVADAVEGHAYAASNGVAVSNFVLPSWFDPGCPTNAPTDQLGKISGPFTVDPSGYAIVMQPGAVNDQTGAMAPMGERLWMIRAQFGERYPLWKKIHKLAHGRAIGRRMWRYQAGKVA